MPSAYTVTATRCLCYTTAPVSGEGESYLPILKVGFKGATQVGYGGQTYLNYGQ